jgi:serine/threonine-protein kinase HipA
MLEQGSSMDGMRPKSFIEIDGESWIVKFPSKNDYDNKAANELIGMRLAQACGIETPEVKLIELGHNKTALAIKRFDTDGQAIYPLMSAASAIGYAEGEQFKKNYRYVAQAIIRLSSRPQEDCLSLFKRLTLNVLISNRDDHIFNQALILKNARWQLSPVYDVVCGEGNSRTHAMTIGEQGATGNLSNVLSAARSFGLNADHAKQVVGQVREVISGWQEIAKVNGVETGNAQQIAWAIAHMDALR